MEDWAVGAGGWWRLIWLSLSCSFFIYSPISSVLPVLPNRQPLNVSPLVSSQTPVVQYFPLDLSLSSSGSNNLEGAVLLGRKYVCICRGPDLERWEGVRRRARSVAKAKAKVKAGADSYSS